MAGNSFISNSNRPNMTKKKLLKLVLYVVILVAAIDVGTGWGFHWFMRSHSIPGDYGKIEYMLKDVDVQILLLGASTCMNSINPELLEKELGKSVFNGGLNDQRLKFFDVMTDAILKRSHPELLVLVLRRNDLVISSNGRLAMMNIYYHLGNKKLDKYLNNDSLLQKILLSSSLYRFNTYWWRIMLYHFKSFEELAHRGFVAKPVPPILPRRVDISPSDADINVPSVNPQKLQCLENILAACREAGTRLWIVITPEFITLDNGQEFCDSLLIREFCQKNNITFFDHSQHPDFMDHPEYFYDNNHLNGNGAIIYTQLFMKMLQNEGL